MQWQRRVVQSALALEFLIAAACAGSVGDPEDSSAGGSGGGDIELPPIDKDSLRRNPSRRLVCEDPDKPQLAETPLVRLTNAEYHNAVADLIAPLSLAADDQPALPLETPFDGYSNHHKGQTPSTELIETFETGSLDVGDLVIENFDELGIDDCPPKDADDEQACFDAFVDSFAMRAFRHPLDDNERERLSDFYEALRDEYDFDQAMRLVVNGVLQTPQFLYRIELGQGNGKKMKLSGYEVASRLSFLLWDTMPDDELFEAAANGDLDSADGIQTELARMLADPRSQSAIERFTGEWLGLDRLASFAEAKDTDVFEDFDQAVADDLMEGLRLYIEETLTNEGGGLQKLLTSRTAFVNARTAGIYGVDAPDGNKLARVKLDRNERKGLTTQAAVLAGLAAETEHSPILRGVWMMEHILCQPPPPPPEDLDTDEPAPAPDSNLTKRERTVIEHGAKAICSGCHQQIDGIGFGYENYDAIGQYRTEEIVADGTSRMVDPSASIIGSGDMDGEYENALSMIDAVAASEQVAQCFVEHFYRYALARSTAKEDGCNIARITDKAVESEGDFQSLLRSFVTTDAFRFRTQFAQ